MNQQMQSGLAVYHLVYGRDIVGVVKGKSGMTAQQVREQAKINLRLELEIAPGLLSKIHYSHVEEIA